MKAQTIRALNQLNLDFYQQVASEFSASRQYAWSGWEQLWTKINSQLPHSLRCLDVGCGNGRFAEFLAQKSLPALSYTGWDSSPSLLALARARTFPPHVHSHWQEVDVVEGLLNNNFTTSPFDLITLFGVMHHIPGFELRHKLLTTLLNQIEPQGFLVFTVWKFLDAERLKRKRLPFSLVGIDETELETDDYLLDWKRGTTAYRYAHYLSAVELDKLLNDLPATVLTTFTDDAKEGNLNLYVILQKN